MKNTRQGFTVTEILIVLVISLILLGMIYATVVRSIENARKDSCLSSIRQVNLALTLYTQDYDGIYPSFFGGKFKALDQHLSRARDPNAKTWSELTLPYLNQKFASCPSGHAEIPAHTQQFYLLSYALNTALSGVQSENVPETVLKTYTGKGETELPYPNLTVALADARLGILAMNGPDDKEKDVFLIYPRRLKSMIMDQSEGATRHQGGANYAFADGHIKWFKPDQLSVDPKCAGQNPGFGL